MKELRRENRAVDAAEQVGYRRGDRQNDDLHHTVNLSQLLPQQKMPIASAPMDAPMMGPM